MATMLVKQIYEGTTTGGNNTHVYIEDLVLEAGIYDTLWDIFFAEISDIQYTQSHSLIYDIIQYDSLHFIKISTPHGILSPQRRRDIALTTLAFERWQDKSALNTTQRVRMSFYFPHIGNICSTNGEKGTNIVWSNFDVWGCGNYLKQALRN